MEDDLDLAISGEGGPAAVAVAGRVEGGGEKCEQLGESGGVEPAERGEGDAAVGGECAAQLVVRAEGLGLLALTGGAGGRPRGRGGAGLAVGGAEVGVAGGPHPERGGEEPVGVVVGGRRREEVTEDAEVRRDRGAATPSLPAALEDAQQLDDRGLPSFLPRIPAGLNVGGHQMDDLRHPAAGGATVWTYIAV